MRLSLLCLGLIGLASASNPPGVKFPATIEIDLVSPRNETYATAPSLPVVFAVQNPHAASANSMSIRWTLQRNNNNNNDTPVDSPLPYDGAGHNTQFSVYTSDNGADQVSFRVDSIFPNQTFFSAWRNNSSLSSPDLNTGNYVLSWEAHMSICEEDHPGLTYKSSERVASGQQYFAIVDRGDAAGVVVSAEIGYVAGKCPTSGSRFTADHTRGELGLCYVLDDPPNSEPELCRGKLQGVELECIEKSLAGKNTTGCQTTYSGASALRAGYLATVAAAGVAGTVVWMGM